MMLKRVLAAGALVYGAVSASGCADNEASLYVIGHLALTAPECKVTADASSAMLLGSGELDRWAPRCPSQYVATLLVSNAMRVQGDDTLARAETSRVSIYEAEVTIEDVGGAQIDAFRVPVNATLLPPSSGASGGLSVVSVTLLPASTMAKLPGRVTVVTRTVLRGRSNGGKELESKEFAFPIAVSQGLKERCPGSGSDTVLDDPCYPGQGFYCCGQQDDTVKCGGDASRRLSNGSAGSCL